MLTHDVINTAPPLPSPTIIQVQFRCSIDAESHLENCQEAAAAATLLVLATRDYPTVTGMDACAFTLSLLCVVVGSSLASVVVFQHGEGGYPCIRLPAIARCKGLLHGFAECRAHEGDGCYPLVLPKPGGSLVCILY